MHTIVAPATPLQTSGVAIIRVSGKRAKEIAEKMIRPVTEKAEGFSLQNRYMHLCEVRTESFCDEGLVVYFKEPNSFTGEDVVEFQVHGGISVINGIIDEVIKLGAKPAKSGEFTQRAFLNGKISLEKAEAIIDIIEATSEKEVACGYNLYSGKFFDFIKQLQNGLSEVLARVNVNIDYPSEDVEEAETELIISEIKKITAEIEKVRNTFVQGKVLKSGVDVLILGKPNAGKSSLLNSLSGEDAAIVSNISGTTRDLVKATIKVNGVKVNLIDTAGLRETENEIEKIGIEKAKGLINNVDVIIYVLDALLDEKALEKELFELKKIRHKNVIIVLNKTDIESKLKLKEKHIKVSAVTNAGISELKEAIIKNVDLGSLNAEAVVLTNSRHNIILTEACEFLNDAIKDSGKSLDLIAEDITNCYRKLGEITGETTSEKVIDQIFSKFCLGK